MTESKTVSLIPFSLETALITFDYKNAQDSIYAVMPAFMALATGHFLGSINFMTSARSLATSILATKLALSALEPGILWLNGFNNTEALNKCAEEQGIFSGCVVSKALLENLPIATMTLVSWDSLGNAEPETDLVTYSIQKGVSMGAIGLPIGCVLGGYDPTVLGSIIWSTRFIVKFAALAATKDALEANTVLSKTMVKPAIYLTSFAIGKSSQEIFHESTLFSHELTPYEGEIGAVNTISYRLAADFMPSDEMTSYISAIVIETIDGMLRHSLQKSETINNNATYDVTNENDYAINQETAIASWSGDV